MEAKSHLVQCITAPSTVTQVPLGLGVRFEQVILPHQATTHWTEDMAGNGVASEGGVAGEGGVVSK